MDTASATPLLDRLQPLPKMARTNKLLLVLIGVAAALVGIYIPENLSGAAGSVLIWLAGFYVMMFVGVAIHELGHLAAGKLAGLEFRQILAGPWMVSKESSGYKVRFLPRRILASFGLTLMIPRSAERLRHDFTIMVLGGPAATALLFLPVVFLPWGTLTSCLLVANGILALGSWAPMETRGYLTDAKALLTLAREGPACDRLTAVLYVLLIDNQGVEPVDWPQEVVDKLRLDIPGPHAVSIASLLYGRALQAGDAEAMAPALEAVLRLARAMNVEYRRAYCAECALFQGFYRRNAALAEAWLAEARGVKRTLSLKDWDAAACAAVSFANGNYEQAREELGRAVVALDRVSRTQGRVVARKRVLEGLAERCGAARSAAG